MKKLTELFLSKGLLLASAIISICCYLVDAIWANVNGQIADYAWILLVLTILILWAFFTGQINVQKMLFGAILLAMVYEQFNILELDKEFLGYVSISDIITVVLSIIVFLSHMYLQMEHDGKSVAIFMNLFIGVIMLFFLITAVVNLVFVPDQFNTYVFLFGYAINCIMVICMEMRVEKYKQIRDAARKEGTWTEEKRSEAKKLFKLG